MTPSLTYGKHLLLVEDSPADAMLVTEALRSTPIPVEVHTAHDGGQALKVLGLVGAEPQPLRPHLVLLDLSLPGKDGCEVLTAIKATENHPHLPVVIFSSSASQEDVLRCYRLHANGYVLKPTDPDEFSYAVQAITSYWFRVARLPS